VVGLGTITGSLASCGGFWTARLEDLHLAQSSRLRRGRDSGEQTAVGKDQQSTVEAQLDLHPPSGQ